MMTEPPLPPLPPSGPPRGLNFSRCTEAQPWPPWPACTFSTAWSANSAMSPHSLAPGTRRWRAGIPRPAIGGSALAFVPCQAETCCRSATGTMFTARRPRKRANSTFPATRANSVSSSPRPTPLPGWKWVPRCRTMISPALTCWPPNRLTPRRWELESRPFLLDDAPFLCAISALLRGPRAARGGPGRRAVAALGDAGDLHLGVLLPVAQPAPVAGLVLVADHVDLGSAGGADDLGGDVVAAEFLRVGHHVVTVHDEQDGKRERGAHLTGQAVHGEDVVYRRLLLPAAAAHDRVHRNSLSVMCGPIAVPASADRHRYGRARLLRHPASRGLSLRAASAPRAR